MATLSVSQKIGTINSVLRTIVKILSSASPEAAKEAEEEAKKVDNEIAKLPTGEQEEVAKEEMAKELTFDADQIERAADPLAAADEQVNKLADTVGELIDLLTTQMKAASEAIQKAEPKAKRSEAVEAMLRSNDFQKLSAPEKLRVILGAGPEKKVSHP